LACSASPRRKNSFHGAVGDSNFNGMLCQGNASCSPICPVQAKYNAMKTLRALAFKSGTEVRLLSRNRTLFNDDYPALVDGLKLLRPKDFIIDGEVAAPDQNAKSSFQLLQSYGIRKQTPLVYYAFDLLSLEDTDLRVQPLIERRKLLAKHVTSIPGYLLQPLRKKAWSHFRKVIHS
jgi:ATP-dependent DNA ligase